MGGKPHWFGIPLVGANTRAGRLALARGFHITALLLWA